MTYQNDPHMYGNGRDILDGRFSEHAIMQAHGSTALVKCPGLRHRPSSQSHECRKFRAAASWPSTAWKTCIPKIASRISPYWDSSRNNTLSPPFPS